MMATPAGSTSTGPFRDGEPGSLEPVIARRAEHVVAKNHRVLATLAAFEAGDLMGIRDAFGSVTHRFATCSRVSTPELDALVKIADEVPGVVGARRVPRARSRSASFAGRTSSPSRGHPS
jgi:galactokinase